MSKLELVLVRHGRVDFLDSGLCYGWTDLPLNEQGRTDALRAAEQLENEQFDTVYSSTLKRAVCTAETILQRNIHQPAPNIELADDLREFHFGSWETVPYATIYKDYMQEWDEYVKGAASFRAPGGESLGEFGERVVKWVDSHILSRTSGKILVVTHYGVLAVILPYLLHMGQEACWRFKINTGGITRFDVVDGFARMLNMNV
ncbi:MAG: histidine phosphatase family protein [Christensenellales bacterium]